LSVWAEPSYHSRRKVPTYQEVADVLWPQGSGVYNLSGFPGIQAEVAAHKETGQALAGALYDGLIERLANDFKDEHIFVVEIGVFRGGSTLKAARKIREHCPKESFIMSIDTWLNDYCLGMPKVGIELDPSQYCFYPSAGGSSLMYHAFLTAVLNAGMQDLVVPFPSSTNNAAVKFFRNGWMPHLVYVDASHTFVDVIMDMESWWLILGCGGYMFGDDFGASPGVQQALSAFAFRRGFTIDQYRYDSKYWVFHKTCEDRPVPQV
jgi:hypothetical protein